MSDIQNEYRCVICKNLVPAVNSLQAKVEKTELRLSLCQQGKARAEAKVEEAESLALMREAQVDQLQAKVEELTKAALVLGLSVEPSDEGGRVTVREDLWDKLAALLTGGEKI